MYLRSITTTNFGKLPNEILSFGKGLTVVKGPNEAGKSFSIEAIIQALYGDAASGAANIREHCRKWGSEGAFSLELEIECKGEKYIVIRDFKNKKNILVKPDKTEIKDKESVRKMVAELVGLPSQIAFEATACIPQEDVEKIGNAVSTLREIIEERLTGSGSDTNKIVKKINIAREKICLKSGKKGDLVNTNMKILELEKELAIMQNRLEELTENKTEFESVSQKLQSEILRLQDKETAFKGFQDYMAAQTRFEKADKDYESIQEKLNKYIDANEAINNATTELKSLKAKLEILLSVIKNGEDYREAEAKCGELENKATDLKKKISAIKKIEISIQEKQKELKSYKKVDYTSLKNARTIPSEISGLRLSLAEHLFGIKVELEDKVEFSIISDGKEVVGSEAEMHVEAIVKFPGIAAVQVKNLTGKEKPVVEEIERKEEVLKRILKRYEIKNSEELEALYDKRGNAVNEKNNLELRKDTLLGGDDLSKLQMDFKKLEIELKKTSQIRKELKSHAITALELQKKKGNKQKLEVRIGELINIVTRSNGILFAIGSDENELNEFKKKAAKELIKAEAQLDEKKVFECTPEVFAKLKRETETLQDEVKKLDNRLIKLNFRIDQETVGIEDIAVIEERLNGLKTKKERLRHKFEVLGIIYDNITWARERSIAQFQKSIENQMSIILSKITDGKYEKVKVDENLEVSLYSKEKGEYINIDDKIQRLSSGTVDQVYLAARLAILELLVSEEKPPIILDDTFVSFDDMGRKERAFRVLEAIAKDCQILYFTCHDCPEGFNVVELT